MTFLAPLTGLVAAGLAAAGVLFSYFLKLRRRPIRVSSTLLWHHAAHDLEVNTPFRWLRANWLLMLQILTLALIAAALARPALPSGGIAASRLVIMIDTSASMSIADATDATPRLDAAIARARDLIDRSSGGTRVALVTYAAGVDVLESWTDSTPALRGALAEVRQTEQPDDLATALETVDALLLAGQGGDEQDATAIIVLTDDASEAPSIATAQLSMESFGNRDGSANTGIVGFGARRDYDDPATVRVFARLASNARPDALVPVELAVDAEVVERRAVRLDDNAASLSFAVDAPDQAVVSLRLTNRDALPADDQAWSVLAALDRPGVALVREPEPSGTEWIVEDILRAMDLELVRIVSGSTYREDPARAIGDASLVVLDRLTGDLPPPPPGPLLAIGCVPPIAGLSAGESTGATRVLSWERTHPVLESAGLGRLFIDDAIRIDRSETRGDDVPALVRELALGRAGPLIVEVEHPEYQQIVVAFDPAASSWPLDVGFSIFLATSIERLTASGDVGLGQSFASGRPVVVRGRGGRYVSGNGAELEASEVGRTADFGLAPKVGLYRPTIAGSVPIGVNLASERETLARVSSPIDPANAGSAASAPAQTSIESGPREVWWWFALAAACVVLIEWLVYIVRSRSLTRTWEPSGG